MLDTTRIREGMEVYTEANEKIGEVEFVEYGDEDLDRPGPETATTGRTDDQSPNFINQLARALVNDDDMPEELRARLERYGYIRLDTGNLFESDYYLPFDMVTRINGDNIYVRATKDDLIKA